MAFSEGSTVVQNMTYVAPGYRILCDTYLATFYPSVWRLDSGNYILINTSTVSFVPQQAIGITFICESYHLQFDEMFDVLTNIYIYTFATSTTMSGMSTTASDHDSTSSVVIGVTIGISIANNTGSHFNNSPLSTKSLYLGFYASLII